MPQRSHSQIARRPTQTRNYVLREGPKRPTRHHRVIIFCALSKQSRKITNSPPTTILSQQYKDYYYQELRRSVPIFITVLEISNGDFLVR